MDRHYQYLIVGGGMAADAAVRGIRDVDPDGAIGIVGKDPDPPYKRPWLSKDLWKGESIEHVWLDTAALGVEMHLDRRVESLDLAENRVLDDRGETFTFDSLLLATGVSPRELVPSTPRIIAYRTLADFRDLFELAKAGKRFAVIGGGFIGSEIAAALAMNGKEVELIFPGSFVGERLFPQALAEFITNRYRDEHVHLHPKKKVGTVVEKDDRVVVQLLNPDGTEASHLEVDAVVTGIGAEPNIELAEAAGLGVNNGIVVDRYLKTRQPNVYAAGDVAYFHQPALRKYLRIEHEDNANHMGRAAGRSMAGKREPYLYLPFFYSDMFDLGYEAVGDIDSRLKLREEWTDPNREGVIYYERDGLICGVLLWNVWEKVDDARALINAGRSLPDATLDN